MYGQFALHTFAILLFYSKLNSYSCIFYFCVLGFWVIHSTPLASNYVHVSWFIFLNSSCPREYILLNIYRTEILAICYSYVEWLRIYIIQLTISNILHIVLCNLYFLSIKYKVISSLIFYIYIFFLITLYKHL